jgi:acylphosphatase
VSDGEAGSDPVRLTVWIRGRVQGVGMRWWVRSRALELGLVGTATNLDDGRVEVVAEGSHESCIALLAAIGGEGTPGHVTGVTQRWDVARGGLVGFRER